MKKLEPIPKEFYAPHGLFSEKDIEAIHAKYLGEWIYSPGYSSLYQVASGPLCRLYWNEGRAEPCQFEAGWEEVRGQWRKTRPNFLSYALRNGGFLTVRWKPSMPRFTGGNR